MPSRKPSGTGEPADVEDGQLAASGSVFPCGKTCASGVEVSRQYESAVEDQVVEDERARRS